MYRGSTPHGLLAVASISCLAGAAVATATLGGPRGLTAGLSAAAVALAAGVLVGRRTADGTADRNPPDRIAAGSDLPTTDLRPDGGRTESDLEMVVAIIRPGKLTDVKQALVEADAPSLTVTNVSGRGSQPDKKGEWHGEEYVVDLHQKVKVEVVVADVPAEDVVEAISDAARTGEPGDGKIFVLPVSDAAQVRTGARGAEAI